MNTPHPREPLRKGLGEAAIEEFNSLTAIRVLVGTKNSHPVGFYSRDSMKSTISPNTTIPQI